MLYTRRRKWIGFAKGKSLIIIMHIRKFPIKKFLMSNICSDIQQFQSAKWSRDYELLKWIVVDDLYSPRGRTLAISVNLTLTAELELKDGNKYFRVSSG